MSVQYISILLSPWKIKPFYGTKIRIMFAYWGREGQSAEGRTGTSKGSGRALEVRYLGIHID